MKIDFDGNHPSANGCNTAAGVWRADLDDDLQRDILALVPGLRHYARALSRDAAVAQDLVQECLCRAFAKIHLWERDTDLRAWLFTILHHQHIRYAWALTHDVVAATLGIPVGTVSSRLARGRATLSTLLDSGEDAVKPLSAVPAPRHVHALSEARNRC